MPSKLRSTKNSFPLLLGNKNAPLDWSNYIRRCERALGYLPEKGKPLSLLELETLGFCAAASVPLGSNYMLTR